MPSAAIVCKPPRIHTQLDNGEPTAAWDCGVEGIIRSLDFASCGRIQLDEKVARVRAGKPGKVPTNPADWKRAIEHPDTARQFKAIGLHAPRAQLLDGADVAIAEQGLRDDKMLTAAAWYGTINTLQPNKSASLTFSDNHAIGFLELRTNPSGRQLTVEYDPLADGRKRAVAGHLVEYPDGPQTFPWTVAVAAFGNVRVRTRDANGTITSQHRLGNRRVLGILVKRSEPMAWAKPPKPTPPIVPPTKPPTKPTEPPVTDAELEDQLVAARRGLASAIAYSKAARAALDALDDDLEAALAASGGPIRGATRMTDPSLRERITEAVEDETTETTDSETVAGVDDLESEPSGEAEAEQDDAADETETDAADTEEGAP
jgi:hypothetical protein